MTRSLTRVETVLADAEFGAAVIRGFTQTTPADRAAVAVARAAQGEMRERIGYRRAPAPILTPPEAQTKLSKSAVPSFGMMLTPERGMMRPDLADIRTAYDLGGAWNLCPLASGGCAAACLSTSGQSGMPDAQRAQGARTAFLLARPGDAGLIIGAELRTAIKRHGRINLRLNVTSDIRWELFAGDMIAALTAAGVNFYDYTAWRPKDRAPSPSYRLTYSAKEPGHTGSGDADLKKILSAGGTVAMPFDTARGKPLPKSWHGYRVIDGDKSDDRRRDPAGVVVGLRAKGYAWKRPGGNAAGFIRSSVVGA